MTQAVKDLPIGSRLPFPKYQVTVENISRFHYLLNEMEKGEEDPGPNIHTDLKFARRRGFLDLVADGSQTVSEMSRLLTEYFGDGFLAGGQLVCKFIKPVHPNSQLDIKLTVLEKEESNGSVRYGMELECVNQDGQPVIVGRASAWVR